MKHQSARKLCAGFLVLIAAACGARTELAPTDVTCSTEGNERSCQNECGQGTQTCEAGLWSDCTVAPTTRGCSTTCGEGTQSCTDGAWGRCDVPVATRACADPCGSGTETCRNGSWQACVVPPVQRDCSSVCGPGHETCENGTWKACDAPQPRPPQLMTTVRDFKSSKSIGGHPDFEATRPSGLDLGIVAELLGPDDKPVYAVTGTPQSTSGRSNFDEWYRDVPGVNQSTALDLQLKPADGDPGFFNYDDQAFFPIDGQLFGNERNAHNYHFTLEASTTFEYRGGEVFSFAGDDDMWVFVNRHLAIDLGGLHVSLEAEVSLDAIAGRAGLVRGSVYPLHFFFAERHTTQSHFTIRTSIAEPGSCD